MFKQQYRLLKNTKRWLLSCILLSSQCSFELLSINNDRYTQSQAHMSIPEVKRLIEKHYSLKEYDHLIKEILSREQLYKDSYYVFYHGMDSSWFVAQDLYTQLYQYYNPTITVPRDFVFLRFESSYPEIDPQSFLLHELKNNGLINDHVLGNVLLSVNLALFGNVGTPSECSWEYFMKSRDHVTPHKEIYELILKRFGLKNRYINDVINLSTLYQTQKESLLQIFIPKKLVDFIGYLSWIRGNPADEKIMEWVLASVRSKKFPKTQQSLDALTHIFKTEKEKNPLFSELIEHIKAGKFKLSSFLQIYRNNPASIKNINMFMARLIFTSKVLLNPASGVKFFRYSMATSQQRALYEKKLSDIIKKIVSEK